MKTLLSLALASLCANLAHAAIKSEIVEYQHGDVTLEGVLVYDNAIQGPRPGVLIVHQWKGLGDYERKRATMLAELGYAAFCADIYGKGIRPQTTPEAAAESGKYKSNRPLLRERVNAGLATLRKQTVVDSRRIAAMGYCFGGTTVIELARSGANVAGVVSFHGSLDSPQPADGKHIKCKVLALHGADDPFVPAKDLDAFESELRNAGVDWQLVKYGGAVHSFTDWNADGSLPGATNPTLPRNNVSFANDNGTYEVVVSNNAGAATSTVVNLTVVASNSVPKAYEAKLRQLNPVSYWRLDEATGSTYVNDYWGGNLGLNENVVLEQPGPSDPVFTGLEVNNRSAQYDGFSAATHTTESLMNDRTQFSIIGWFQTSGIIPTRVGLFGQNDVCEFGFHGNGPDGMAQVGIWTPRGAAYLNQSNITSGVWYLVAAIGSGTNVSLRLISTNGAGGFTVLQANTSHTATTNYGNAPFPFRIGGGGILDNATNFFAGLIDEVAVFDRGLSVAELSDLFGAALTGGFLPPGIGSVPTSQTLYAGRTAAFSVSVVGTAPQYQWRSNGIPIANGGNVWGANTDTLVITNVSGVNAADYDVVVTNAVGSVTSAPPATLSVIVPVAGSHESVIIAANPIAYYRFSETNDLTVGPFTAFDYWGGRNGTYGGAAQNGFNGILGPTAAEGLGVFDDLNFAVQTFNAVANSYVTVPALGITTNVLTITAWVNPSAYNDRAGIVFARAGQPATGLNFIGTAGNLNYHWLDAAATYNWDSGLNVPLNQWSFVALVVEPNQATIHLLNTNGVQSASTNNVHAVRTFSDTIRIGGDPNADARTFNGRIDEVAFFNYAMTPAQILGLYLGAPVVNLKIERSGNNLVLTWPQGTLLEASQVTGPYTTNTATSPYVISPTNDAKYYRLIVK